MANQLAGKVAIVTGAARGLGRAFALGYAAEGADVVVVDVADPSATKAAAEKFGVRALALTVDVSSEEQTQRMAQEALKAFGKIDILMNNAAIYELRPFDQLTFAEWKRLMSVNVDGMFLCTKAVAPHMRQQKHGRIINISSGTFWAGTAGFSHYVTSKGAVVGFTRATAAEFGIDGVTVNCIAPGLTQTEGMKAIGPAEVQEMMWEQIIAMQAIKRRETPQDLVGAAVFFASDASSFITGQTLCVDGALVKH